MTKIQAEDFNRLTILRKDGDPTFEMVCPTLLEAIIEVKDHWSSDDQARARFKVAGKEYLYAWSDLELNVD